MDHQPLVNKVAQSGLITINLENYFPDEPTVLFDIKDHLFHGLILKEKEFRLALQSFDWQALTGKTLLVFCSADAIIPMWAYMLIAANATPFAKDIFLGNQEAFHSHLILKAIKALDIENFRDQKIVIKGCGDIPIPAAAYLEITKILRPIAQSIMYGEPCSTVPIFKNKTV